MVHGQLRINFILEAGTSYVLLIGNMDPLELPPAMNCSPDHCFCGRLTSDLHEHLYCSIECARLDALQSLDNSECHYRRVIQAHFQTSAPDPEPDCTMSIDPPPPEQRDFVNASLPFIPPTDRPHQGDATTSTQKPTGDCSMAGFPTLSQVTGKVLIKKATAGKPLVAERHDRPRWEGFPKRSRSSRALPTQPPGTHVYEEISLDAIPLPEPTFKSARVPARTLRRVPTFSSLSNKFRQGAESGNPEKEISHPVNTITPSVRKELLHAHRQMNPSTMALVPNPKALRRSASLSDWRVKAGSDRGAHNAQDPLMHIVEEMREDMSESFDPTFLFAQEEDY